MVTKDKTIRLTMHIKSPRTNMIFLPIFSMKVAPKIVEVTNRTPMKAVIS
jgi:hypothetical protein